MALLAVQGALRLFGFRRVRSALDPGGDREPGRPVHSTGQEAAFARALARRVEQAAGFRVYRVPCLARALLLVRWLHRHGLPARLRIGVRREEGDPFQAHAWVLCGDLILDPDPGVTERFRPLD